VYSGGVLWIYEHKYLREYKIPKSWVGVVLMILVCAQKTTKLDRFFCLSPSMLENFNVGFWAFISAVPQCWIVIYLRHAAEEK